MSETREDFLATQAIVMNAVISERNRQDAKWGDCRESYDGTGANTRPLSGALDRVLFGDPSQIDAAGLADLFRDATDFRATNRIHGVDRADVLLEEVFEALAESEAEPLYEELIQVAAVCVNWCEYLLKRGANPRPAVMAVVA